MFNNKFLANFVGKFIYSVYQFVMKIFIIEKINDKTEIQQKLLNSRFIA